MSRDDGQAQCRDCGQSIIWMKTFSGKNIPVEPDTFEYGDEVYDKQKHTTHFDTCPERSGTTPHTPRQQTSGGTGKSDLGLSRATATALADWHVALKAGQNATQQKAAFIKAFEDQFTPAEEDFEDDIPF